MALQQWLGSLRLAEHQCHLSSTPPCFNCLRVNYSSKCDTVLSDFSCTAMLSLHPLHPHWPNGSLRSVSLALKKILLLMFICNLLCILHVKNMPESHFDDLDTLQNSWIMVMENVETCQLGTWMDTYKSHTHSTQNDVPSHSVVPEMSPYKVSS